ncbi:MAG TPA: HAD-IB family hydrolase [Acidimicrobiales bacterium]|nr:HAD-IB family hydrolase [Acidimicrobiales bacterium]
MRAAFFDLDKTVIAKSSLVALGPELHARGLLHRRTLIRAGISQLWFQRFGADEKRLHKVRQMVLKITRGWDQDEVRRMVKETISEVIEPLLYAEALELIDHHLAEGHEVFLVSSAPAEIVEPFAELLDITGAISSRSLIDEHGKFTGEMAFFAQGENKAVAIREIAEQRGIDLSESYAYSDSETDVPMLEAVGHPFAVNADRTLARYAHEHQWPLLTFSHPVTALSRSKSHTPFLVSALIVGVAAVLGGARIQRH